MCRPQRFITAVAALIATAGCDGLPWRTGSRTPPPAFFQPDFQYGEQVPQPQTPLPAVPLSEIDSVPNADTFTIDFKTYDDEDALTRDPPLAKSWQRAVVVSDERRDADGLMELTEAGPPGSPAGSTWSRFLTGEQKPDPVIDKPVRLGPHTVFIRMRSPGYAPKSFVERFFHTSVGWDFTVVIDGERSQPRVEVAGEWRGAKAALLVINGRRVYQQSDADDDETHAIRVASDLSKPQYRR